MSFSSCLTKERISRSFDRAHASYVRYASVQAEAARACADLIPPGRYGSILEIGAGGGVLTHPAARRFGHDRYVAVDIAPRMLESIDVSQLDNPELVVADGEHLDFEPGAFDLLLSSSTMQWYAHPGESIPANLGLLRPGGRFSLSIFVRGSLCELAEACAATGFGSMLSMRPAGYYVSLLEGMDGLRFQWEVREHVSVHGSVREFLKAHQATGATATQRKKPARPKAYREFIRFYETRFSVPGGVRATSQVLHLWGQRL
ncbi:methyltransferase domain-containing protein [Salidesulfovibrio onnuriiensis]|uniref:methyltransferase domain-containing protein n=1 Tax=Salidesulfovibrio onnuriiensis TaxID=2583823 RepID=UPI00164F639D|nr:methyltransferase domain-containing protein [Salidesulfovibrio onnuriiensis]